MMAANPSTSGDEPTFTMRLSDDQKTKKSTNTSPQSFLKSLIEKVPKPLESS